MTPIHAWEWCLAAEGVAVDGRDRIDAVLRRWSEPHRHYHTPTHLQGCIDGWDRLRNRMQAPALAGLALLYHDAIYDPRSDDNEVASATLARAELSALGLPEPRHAIVESLILATDHRQLPTHADAAIVVDIDLAILGSEPAAYHRYVSEVRQEYAHVVEAEWRSGRARVLRGFLAKPRIFTSGLFDMAEAQARRNLRWELDILSAS